MAAVNIKPHEAQTDNAQTSTEFYLDLGLAILATTLDGNCAFDCVCMMLGKNSDTDSHNALRCEISDYLLERAEESGCYGYWLVHRSLTASLSMSI